MLKLCELIIHIYKYDKLLLIDRYIYEQQLMQRRKCPFRHAQTGGQSKLRSQNKTESRGNTG